MDRIVLISCVSKKRDYRSKAREMYLGPFFRYSLDFAQMMDPDQIFILSAKYGLVDLDQEIEPYDQTLNKMSSLENRVWADSVVSNLRDVVDLDEGEFVFLAGKNTAGTC